MSSAPKAVLTDSLADAIGASRGRVVEAALFTTFSLEPDFFEQEVLPTLFDVAFSTAPKVKQVQLEEAIRQGVALSLYYDPRALSAAGDAPVLDVERVAMNRRTGCFHPKVALVLVRDGDERSLVVLVGSHNLSRAGWWDNVEVSHLSEIREGDESHLRDPLLTLLDTLRKEARVHGQVGTAPRRIGAFLSEQVTTPKRRSRKAPLHERFYVGDEPLPKFIRDALGTSSEDLHLEVVSPYFDADGAGTLKALMDRLRPRSTTVYLPREDDGTAACTPELYEDVLHLGARWGQWRGTLRQRGSRQSERATERVVHAKVYRLWRRMPNREVVILGSANLTRAGHSEGLAGNVEASILVETQRPSGLEPWLEADDERPRDFMKEPPQEDDAQTSLPIAPLDVEFSWATKTVRLWWDAPATTSALSLRMLDATVATELSVEPGWNELPPSVGEAMEAQLQRTAFVTPFIGTEEQHPVLVREEGMAYKPSLLFELAPEDILRYWSLLSEDQRNAFIENEAHLELVAIGLAAARHRSSSEDRSFFSRFAGIFHAFERLEADVRTALETGAFKRAEYRLFGQKYDSLPRLLDKLLGGEGKWDPAERYVALLTARDLVRRLRPIAPQFWSERPQALSALEDQLRHAGSLAESLDLGDDAEARAFLRWFEAAFAGAPR